MTHAELDEVARKLNDRPRHTFGFRTPAEKLTELINGLDAGIQSDAARQGWCIDRLRSSRATSI